MNKKYYRFNYISKIQLSKVQKFLLFFLEIIFPKANPDFEDLIGDVKTWMIEVSNEIPVREIGLDSNGKVILKMPLNRNAGYWTDNNLKEDDFISHFKAEKIQPEEFESFWNKI